MRARLYRLPAADTRGRLDIIVPYEPRRPLATGAFVEAVRDAAARENYPLPPTGLPAHVTFEDVDVQIADVIE